jgi:hypothetical protein
MRALRRSVVICWGACPPSLKMASTTCEIKKERVHVSWRMVIDRRSVGFQLKEKIRDNKNNNNNSNNNDDDDNKNSNKAAAFNAAAFKGVVDWC